MKTIGKAFILAIITVLLLALIINSIVFLYKNCTPPKSSYYSKSGYIIQIDREKDEVTFVDCMGEMWVFYGAEDWLVGDGISAVMDTQGTETIHDDTIVDVRYERWD
jgi:hypothetical protein